MADQTGWVEKATQDNAEATATKAADTNRQHVIFSVDASFSATKTKLLQVKDGSTIKWEGYVYDSREVKFPKAIAMSKNSAVTAVLAASGTGGTIGKVNLHGTSK